MRSEQRTSRQEHIRVSSGDGAFMTRQSGANAEQIEEQLEYCDANRRRCSFGVAVSQPMVRVNLRAVTCL